jgi:hypothetical protein
MSEDQELLINTVNTASDAMEAIRGKSKNDIERKEYYRQPLLDAVTGCVDLLQFALDDNEDGLWGQTMLELTLNEIKNLPGGSHIIVLPDIGSDMEQWGLRVIMSTSKDKPNFGGTMHVSGTSTEEGTKINNIMLSPLHRTPDELLLGLLSVSYTAAKTKLEETK